MPASGMTMPPVANTTENAPFEVPKSRAPALRRARPGGGPPRERWCSRFSTAPPPTTRTRFRWRRFRSSRSSIPNRWGRRSRSCDTKPVVDTKAGGRHQAVRGDETGHRHQARPRQEADRDQAGGRHQARGETGRPPPTGLTAEAVEARIAKVEKKLKAKEATTGDEDKVLRRFLETTRRPRPKAADPTPSAAR